MRPRGELQGMLLHPVNGVKGSLCRACFRMPLPTTQPCRMIGGPRSVHHTCKVGGEEVLGTACRSQAHEAETVAREPCGVESRCLLQVGLSDGCAWQSVTCGLLAMCLLCV